MPADSKILGGRNRVFPPDEVRRLQRRWLAGIDAAASLATLSAATAATSSRSTADQDGQLRRCASSPATIAERCPANPEKRLNPPLPSRRLAWSTAIVPPRTPSEENHLAFEVATPWPKKICSDQRTAARGTRPQSTGHLPRRVPLRQPCASTRGANGGRLLDELIHSGGALQSGRSTASASTCTGVSDPLAWRSPRSDDAAQTSQHLAAAAATVSPPPPEVQIPRSWKSPTLGVDATSPDALPCSNSPRGSCESLGVTSSMCIGISEGQGRLSRLSFGSMLSRASQADCGGGHPDEKSLMMLSTTLRSPGSKEDDSFSEAVLPEFQVPLTWRSPRSSGNGCFGVPEAHPVGFVESPEIASTKRGSSRGCRLSAGFPEVCELDFSEPLNPSMTRKSLRGSRVRIGASEVSRVNLSESPESRVSVQRKSRCSRTSAGFRDASQFALIDSPESQVTMQRGTRDTCASVFSGVFDVPYPAPPETQRKSLCSKTSLAVPDVRQLDIIDSPESQAATQRGTRDSLVSIFSEVFHGPFAAPPETQTSLTMAELDINVVDEVPAMPACSADDKLESISSATPEESEDITARFRSVSPDVANNVRSFVLQHASLPLPYSPLSPEAAEEREHEAAVAAVRCYSPVISQPVLVASEQLSPTSDERAANLRALQATRALQTISAAATASAAALKARKELHRAKQNPWSLLPANSKSVNLQQADMDFRAFQRRVTRLAGQGYTKNQRNRTPDGHASSAPNTARSARSAPRSARSACSSGTGVSTNNQSRINFIGCALQIQDSHSWSLSVKPDPETFASSPRRARELFSWASSARASQPQSPINTDLARDFLPEFFRLSDEERRAGPPNDPNRFEHTSKSCALPTSRRPPSPALLERSVSEPALTQMGLTHLQPSEFESLGQALKLAPGSRHMDIESMTNAGTRNRWSNSSSVPKRVTSAGIVVGESASAATSIGCSSSSSIPTLAASVDVAASACAGTSNGGSSSSSMPTLAAALGIASSTLVESDGNSAVSPSRQCMSSTRTVERLWSRIASTDAAKCAHAKPDVFNRLSADAERRTRRRSPIEDEVPKSVRDMPSNDHEHVVHEMRVARDRASSGPASSRGLRPRAATEGAASARTDRKVIARHASMCDLMQAGRSSDDSLDCKPTSSAMPRCASGPSLGMLSSKATTQTRVPEMRFGDTDNAYRHSSLSPECIQGRGPNRNREAEA